VSSVGDNAELKNVIKVEDWNDIHIIARGNVIIQIINGRVMSQLIDDDKVGTQARWDSSAFSFTRRRTR